LIPYALRLSRATLSIQANLAISIVLKAAPSRSPRPAWPRLDGHRRRHRRVDYRHAMR
jgi:hypothetical protein